MMNHVVKIKKGLDIQLEGAPALEISNSTNSQLYAIIPDDFTGLTPKVDVKPGDKVLAGSPVMHDKTLTDVVVTSPVSGEASPTPHNKPSSSVKYRPTRCRQAT